MKITKAFADSLESLQPMPKTLAKGSVVEEMVVSSVSDDLIEFGDTAPEFLRGKHSMIVTGERGGDTVVVSVLAEQAWSEMSANGITPFRHEAEPKRGNVPAKEAWVELPDCVFSATGYTQSWKLT